MKERAGVREGGVCEGDCQLCFVGLWKGKGSIFRNRPNFVFESTLPKLPVFVVLVNRVLYYSVYGRVVCTKDL